MKEEENNMGILTKYIVIYKNLVMHRQHINIKLMLGK